MRTCRDGMYHPNGNISNWDTSRVTNMNNMFRGAAAFAGDISNWNISSATSMIATFKDATSFNHDLCVWRHKFPYANANDTFMGSGCTYQDTPRLHQRGPFCASSCMTQSNTNANANSSPAVSFYYACIFSMFMISLGS